MKIDQDNITVTEKELAKAVRGWLTIGFVCGLGVGIPIGLWLSILGGP